MEETLNRIRGILLQIVEFFGTPREEGSHG